MSKDLVPKFTGTSPKSTISILNKKSENVVSPSSINRDDNVTDNFAEQPAPLSYPMDCNLAAEEEASTSHISSDTQKMNILVKSASVSSPIISSRIPAGYRKSTKVSGSSETSPSARQIPRPQEQMMQKHKEKLQKLFAEKQRIFTLYHSGLVFQTQNDGKPLNVALREDTQEEFKKRRKDEISAQEEMHQKMSPIKEEKGEKTDSQIPLSPFGVRMHSRTRNMEERPIRPGTGIREKTFEEIIEKQLKMDFQKEEKQIQQCKQQNSCQSKSFLRNPFLKHKEGISGLKQNKENFFTKNPKQPIKQMAMKVSFGYQPHFHFPQLQDWVKHKQENRPVLEWQANTHMVTLCIEKEIAKIPSQKEAKEDTKNSKSKENSQWLQDRSGEAVKRDSTLIAGMNWPDLMQPYHIQENESLIGEKNGTWSPDHQNHLDNRKEATDNWVQQHLQKLSPSQGNETLIEEKTLSATGDSGPQEAVETPEMQVDEPSQNHNSENVCFVSCQSNEKLLSSRAVPGHRTGASPEFKKANDRKVKIDHQLNKGMEKEFVLVSDHKRKQQDSGRMVRSWNDKSSSSDEKSSLSGSTTCHSCPRSKDPMNVDTAKQNLDLSESDYASDEPSESEEMVLRRPRKFFVKKRRPQELLELKDHSPRASSSESSTKATELRSSRSMSYFRKFQDQYFGPTRYRQEMKTKNTSKSTQVPDMQPPTCDLVASLFPVLKDKVNSPCRIFHGDALEAQKRSTGKLKEREEEIDELHGENPLFFQVKAQQEKIMQFLRTQINHFETEKPKEVSISDEHWKEENSRPQLTKANLEKWTKASRISKREEDTKEMLILKQQISGLQEQFKINETRWSAAHIKLQNQIEALMKQNLELQDELRASEHQRLGITKKSSPLHSARRKSESLASELILRGSLSKNEGTTYAGSKSCIGQKSLSEKHTSVEPASNKTERMESKKTSKDHREKTVSRSLRVRSPPPTGKRSALEKKNPQFDPEMVIHRPPRNTQRARSRKSPVPTAQLIMYNEENLTAHENDRNPLNSGNYEDAILIQVRNNDHRSSAFRKDEDTQTYSSKSARSRKLSLPMKNKKREEEIQREIQHPDGKVEWKFSDGRKTITFPNGTKKDVSADKKTTVITFPNGDVQKFMPDKRVLYYYADAQTTHTTYPSGLEVLQFPNNQIEKHHPNGTKEIVFPDGTVKNLGVGHEETVFPDGTVVKVERNGDKTIMFSNGQKEIHTSQYKRREFPDGTIKTVYNTGQQETKYLSGRVRIKDEAGHNILDKK